MTRTIRRCGLCRQTGHTRAQCTRPLDIQVDRINRLIDRVTRLERGIQKPKGVDLWKLRANYTGSGSKKYKCRETIGPRTVLDKMYNTWLNEKRTGDYNYTIGGPDKLDVELTYAPSDSNVWTN